MFNLSSLVLFFFCIFLLSCKTYCNHIMMEAVPEINFETFANTSFAFGRRDASYIQQIEGQTTEVRKCRSL